MPRIKSRALRGCLIIICGLVITITIAVVAITTICRISTQRYRSKALVEVQRMSSDESWMSSQMEAMKQQTDSEGEWFSQHVVRMKNGEWIVCSSMCYKVDWKIRDTFICKASNGIWYDSTHHFCVGMCVLRSNGQPESLQEFISQYGLKKIEAPAVQSSK